MKNLDAIWNLRVSSDIEVGKVCENIPPIDWLAKSRYEQKRIYLGWHYPGVYLTTQEAHCMQLFLQGYVVIEVGKKLNLSPHTVSFYCRNMKCRLGCKTRQELLAKVRDSDFLKNYARVHGV